MENTTDKNETQATPAVLRELTLPSWAKRATEQQDPRHGIEIDIDGEAAYQEWLELLKSKYAGQLVVDLDQYWLQVMHECIKLDVYFALEGTEFDPDIAGMPPQLTISRANDFAMAGKPDRYRREIKNSAGEVTRVITGPDKATRGQEGRKHYAIVRGRSALIASLG